MSAFTPGPWRVKLLAPKFVEVCDDNGKPIVTWPGFDESNVPLKRHEANARLIAAAPDLLEALKNTASALACAIRANLSRDLYDSDADYDAAVRDNVSLAEARAAIAKAEGIEVTQ